MKTVAGEERESAKFWGPENGVPPFVVQKFNIQKLAEVEIGRSRNRPNSRSSGLGGPRCEKIVPTGLNDEDARLRPIRLRQLAEIELADVDFGRSRTVGVWSVSSLPVFLVFVVFLFLALLLSHLTLRFLFVLFLFLLPKTFALNPKPKTPNLTLNPPLDIPSAFLPLPPLYSFFPPSFFLLLRKIRSSQRVGTEKKKEGSAYKGHS